ncbi:malate synthase A [Georgenia sp. M64]|uniref:malate synthase A n=1 Tax=Georgenia sp. M64 TaxID=3120520 RepID=UPI0030DEB2C9
MTTTAGTTPTRLVVAPPRRTADPAPLRVVAPSASTPASAPVRTPRPAPRPGPAVEVLTDVPGATTVLTGEALAFLARLHTRFAARRAELLTARHERRQQLVVGRLPDFLPETRHIRDDRSWQVAPPAPGLVDRRVEITGPTERKMTVNALNSGAKVWLADLEDANTPHFANVVDGQVNLRDAVRREISWTSPEGREYRLREGDLPTIVVRPRGWHLLEKHLRVGGEPMVAGLVDVGLYLFHNAAELVTRGTGPYFYLPKLENHLEARLWHDVFAFAEEDLGIARGTVRATVLIETIMAAFEMEEILYELREYSAGLNAGRWDYLFSVIKKFRDSGPAYVLPDRADVTMTAPFMHAYTELLVRTCHKRGAHAIGGMSAFIPSRDPVRDAEVESLVRADKRREAEAGFDGSWVAHPGMVGYVRDVFDDALGRCPNQLWRTREEVHVTARNLLDVAATPGHVTLAGVRTNVAVALRYLEAWLGGRGAVAIGGLMEDAATAEISRSQVWQWIRNGTRTAEGVTVTGGLVRTVLDEETATLTAEAAGDPVRRGRVAQAAELFAEVALGEEFPTFLTVPAYTLRVD